jgi:hypothetical protein
MICYDAGRVVSGDFYGDAQFTRIGVGGDGVRLIAESGHYRLLVAGVRIRVKIISFNLGA